MRTLTDKDKKTIRIAGMLIAGYLVLFAGYKLFKSLDSQRTEYRKLVVEARDLKAEVKRYQSKIEVVKKLMEDFQINPAKLTRATTVAEASSAIQKAAQGGGVQLGPIRETASRASSKELASIQVEGTGPVQAAIGLFGRLQSCGYPLIIDSAQITADPMRQGQIKLNLTIVILDFEQWKLAEGHHA